MKRYMIILVLIGLAGCKEQERTVNGKDTVNIATDGYDAAVRMVTTTDGTRCAVMVGMSRGGISCDWDGSRKAAP